LRRDELFLADMVAAADAISAFVAGSNEAEFIANDLLRSAVLQKLTVIGEAAARLSDGLKQQDPTVPWRDIVAFRNIAVHRYFGIDWSIVWIAATSDVPTLRDQASQILSALGEGGPT
jgi:uncharacterized protein with HEPN domain